MLAKNLFELAVAVMVDILVNQYGQIVVVVVVVVVEIHDQAGM